MDATMLRYLLPSIVLLATSTIMAETSDKKYVIILHGGAGKWNVQPDQTPAVEAALAKALQTGQAVLAKGGKSLDAVETTIRILEDSPWFNAGKGAAMNEAGEFELDASIMDGAKHTAGAVAALSNTRHPITLARRVMEQTPHVLLIGAGAEAFARQQEVELVEPSYFRTERQAKALERVQQRTSHWDPKSDGTEPARQALEDHGPRERAHEHVPEKYSEKYGTVGCVALDTHGNLAAGTSTGGITNKRAGRVGDSPLIGAGTYADNATCAVSCTGVGELFIKHAIAYDLSAQIKYSQAMLVEAAKQNIHERIDANTGGLIAVDRNGHIAIEFNTQRMAYGVAHSSGRFEVKLEKQK